RVQTDTHNRHARVQRYTKTPFPPSQFNRPNCDSAMWRNGFGAVGLRASASVIRLPSPRTANSSQTRAGQGVQQERKMYQVQSSKRMMVGALVLSSVALVA